ncbi:MAG TPA: metallophosphoesterase family protein [Longimicrobium sp.]|nr:metallophosphoesterase family protein [Longimicrobium sp.]
MTEIQNPSGGTPGDETPPDRLESSRAPNPETIPADAAEGDDGTSAPEKSAGSGTEPGSAPPADPADEPPEPGDAEATPPETALAGAPGDPEAASPPAAPDAEAAGKAPAVNVLEVRELDWNAIRAKVAEPFSPERAERIIAAMEERLAGGGPIGLAFEEYAAGPGDQAVQVGDDWPMGEVWFVGDLHGDLLGLEAALQHIDRSGGGADARIVFLGDLFDDGVHAAEVVLRVFELLLNGPMRVTVIAGNHDEALAFEDGQFQSTVIPSDFTDWLNAQSRAGHPWAARLGRLIIRFFGRAPRALFFPDGLLVAHGGIPHTDLHAELAQTRDWNDPRVLQDFVWLRAHPRARKRIPNRTTRGSEFGREDFAAFCQVATSLGRPVGRMVRGHDHVEERFAVFPAWAAHPALTINTLSHRLPREVFGPYERVPVIARWVRGELPEVRRLFIPPELIREIYPEPADAAPPAGGA